MADTKISALTAVTTPAGTDEFGVNQGGTSKKETLSQIRGASSAPTVISVGTEFTGTGVPTATLPGTHATNDILILVLQSSNENITAPSGYTQLGPQNGIGTPVTAGSTRMAIFWKRDGGSESAPTIADSGDHTYGMMFAVRGCPTTGDPFTFGGNNFKFVTSTSGTSPSSVTVVDNTLVIDIWGGSIDNASAQGSSLANADLTSVTEQFDDGTTDGTGGNILVASGLKATAGSVIASTITWANTSVDLCTRIHFLPLDIPSTTFATRATQSAVFIGSRADTDDTWVKPTGARNVRVQTCDGGGGGSGGNTTTTAAGGGGGGGGGYSECFYDADALAASITLHAGKGGNVGTALNAAGTAGVVSFFGTTGPQRAGVRIAGTAATAAASANGGDGGCGSGSGTVSPVVSTRRALNAANAACAPGYGGAPGGNGSTSPVGGSEGDFGGGGGESGADTDAGTTSANNGSSMRGAGGGGGGRTSGTASGGGNGGGTTAPGAGAGVNGNDSAFLPYGGSGASGGDQNTAAGGNGGFPGGGGGGGGGFAGGFGGGGGHGCVVVTTYF